MSLFAPSTATKFFGKFTDSEKFRQCSGDENPEKERYAYSTSCVNFPDNKFSIADLSTMIKGENTKSVDRDSKRIELWKLNRNYLRKFSVRIERHKADYAVIGRVYNLGINRDEFSEFSGLETLSYTFTNICRTPARTFLCTAVIIAFVRKTRKDVT